MKIIAPFEVATLCALGDARCKTRKLPSVPFEMCFWKFCRLWIFDELSGTSIFQPILTAIDSLLWFHKNSEKFLKSFIHRYLLFSWVVYKKGKNLDRRRMVRPLFLAPQKSSAGHKIPLLLFT